MPEDPRRAWLIARIEIAQDMKNAEPHRRDMRFGRLLGFLEVGTRFGWWSKRSADYHSEAVWHGVARGKAHRLLRKKPQRAAKSDRCPVR